MLRLRSIAAALSTAALLLVGCGDDSGEEVDSPPTAGPNIILFQTDDQWYTSLGRRTMPSVSKLLAARGTTFTQYIVTSPQCCPSRASLLTGQYPHNNGVLSNDPGYPALRNPAETLPVWLRDAGYRTAHVGKYLNGYDQGGMPAPGWDAWHTLTSTYTHYYNYDLSVNGRKVHFGSRPSDYVTRALTRASVRLLRRFLPDPAPLYLQLDESAPHDWFPGRLPCGTAAAPDPRDVNRYSRARLPTPPSFDESQLGDKPSFVRRLPSLDAITRKELEHVHRCTLAALRGVDRSVRAVWRAVRAEGELRNTVFAFVSDNGYFFGEHRITSGKVLPYEEAIRVPLILRVPVRLLGRAPKRSVDVLAANIDLAPTFVDLAGACPAQDGCRVMDGRSLVGALKGERTSFMRRSILIEYDGSSATEGGIELARARLEHGVCAYRAVRERRYLYVRYLQTFDATTGRCVASDETEFYDIQADPFELNNLTRPGLAASEPELALRTRLGELTDCGGVAGRDPEPVSAHFCD
jgi:N-acetylglucosamine-6-sulfatase